MMNKTMNTTTLSVILLFNAVIVTLYAAEAEAEIETNDESTNRILQAGSYGGSSSSSGGSSSGAAAGLGLLVGLFASGGSGGKIIAGVVVAAILVGVCVKYMRRKRGEAPSETKFFEGNNQGEDDDVTDNDSIGKFEQPFYSGLYGGFYEQHGARMPIQPFEIYFQEQFLEPEDNDDDDDDSVFTIFHTISGKGADLVGPYTLIGKSVGNKVSITKKYYGQGNQVTDIGHTVTLRLDKLNDKHIFEGKYFVNTDEVQEQGLYQIWPVGYNDNATTAFDVADEESQVPIAPVTAIAVASSMTDERSEDFETITLDHEQKTDRRD